MWPWANWAAETLVMRSMADLSDGMNRLERHYFAESWADMTAEAEKLQKIAQHIGMTTMHRVMGDVIECIAVADETPLSATMNRLRRITDKSLGAAWEMQGVS